MAREPDPVALWRISLSCPDLLLKAARFPAPSKRGIVGDAGISARWFFSRTARPQTPSSQLFGRSCYVCQNALHRHDPRNAKPLTAFVTSLILLATALPALAQQEQGAGRVIWGWQPFMMVGMILGPIIVVLAIIGMMVIFVWLVRWATRGYPFYGQGLNFRGDGGRAAVEILDERFARGEIDKAEFEDKRKLLGR